MFYNTKLLPYSQPDPILCKKYYILSMRSESLMFCKGWCPARAPAGAGGFLQMGSVLCKKILFP